MEEYEFVIRIWKENENEWIYHIYQEAGPFSDVEVIAWGTTESREDAAHCVATELKGFSFE